MCSRTLHATSIIIFTFVKKNTINKGKYFEAPIKNKQSNMPKDNSNTLAVDRENK
jgi:hypothetical protein